MVATTEHAAPSNPDVTDGVKKQDSSRRISVEITSVDQVAPFTEKKMLKDDIDPATAAAEQKMSGAIVSMTPLISFFKIGSEFRNATQSPVANSNILNLPSALPKFDDEPLGAAGLSAYVPVKSRSDVHL
jgi:hypothetical protein